MPSSINKHNIESGNNKGTDSKNRGVLLKRYLEEREARKSKAEIQQRSTMYVKSHLQETCTWLQNQQHVPPTQDEYTMVSLSAVANPVQAPGGKMETSCFYREAQNCVNESWVPLSTQQTWYMKNGELIRIVVLYALLEN